MVLSVCVDIAVVVNVVGAVYVVGVAGDVDDHVGGVALDIARALARARALALALALVAVLL